MRILLVPAAGGVGLGPLTNVLAIAEAAACAGHTVGFVCRESWQPLLKRLGCEFYPAPAPKPLQRPIPPPYKLSDVVVGLGWADESYVRASLQAERQAIVSFHPDTVVTVLQLTAPIAAAIEKVPSVAIAGWADGPDFVSPLYRADETCHGWETSYNHVLEEHGLDPIADICDLAYLRSDLWIAPTIPELQTELAGAPRVHFVGYLISDRMDMTGELEPIDGEEGGSPIIHVYMSPGDIPLQQWASVVVEAFQETEFYVRATLAPLDIPSRSLPSTRNVRFFRWLPAKMIALQSSLIISHGGLNTVTDALLSGIPQIVFPDRYAERDYNGRSVERVGAGLNCSTERFNAQELRDIARRLTRDPNYKSNAARLGERVRECGGGRRVVEILESEL